MTHLWDMFTDTCKRCGVEREPRASSTAPGVRFPNTFLHRYKRPGEHVWANDPPECTGQSLAKTYQPTGKPKGRPKKNT